MRKTDKILHWLVSAVLLVMAGIMVSSPSWGGEGDAFYLCKKMSTPPTIDGTANPDEWAQTEVGGPLTVTNTGAKAPVSTLFRVGYDADNIYCAIICEETEPEKMLANVKVRDGDVYSDDCIEFCLDSVHQHTNMVKFIVNSLGTVCDFKYGNTDWNADIDVAASKSGNSWTVEMRIPFSELGASPKSGDVWGLNVFRTRYAKDTELFNWFNARGVFTLPARMGHLVFDGPGVKIPDMAAVHSKIPFKLEPELAHLGPSFEGLAWTPMDNELAQDQSMRTSITIPHLRMSGPFPQGQVKALVFLKVPGTGRDAGVGTRARDIVELADRFDIQPTAVFVNDQGIVGGELGERRLRALLQERYDLFMFVGVQPGSVPALQMAKIKALIEKGAGALFVYEGKGFLEKNAEPVTTPASLAKCLPISRLTGYKSLSENGITGVAEGDKPLLNCFSFGKGRAALIAYPGDVHSLTRFVGVNSTILTEYDYWLGFAGLTAVWCAGRDSGMVINIPDNPVFESQKLPATHNVTIRSGSSNGLGDLTLDAYVRDADGNRTKVLSRSLHFGAAQEGNVAIELPVLPYGRYFLEVQAWRGKSVAAFSTGVFDVQGPSVLDELVIKDDCTETGNAISGTFKTSGLDSFQDAGCRVELVTRDGRVLAQEQLKDMNQQEHNFSLAVPQDTTISMDLRVTVTDKRGVVTTASKPFFIPNRRRGTFNGIMWDAPDEPMGIYAYESMRRAGFNISLNGTATPVTDWTDFSAVAYAARLTNGRDGNGVTNQGCWENEGAVEKRITAAVDKEKNNWKRGVFAYSLGDENDTLGCCLDPACLAAYREYLAKQYGSIEALNASWGENYKSFDDVTLLEGDDFFMESQAFKTGKYARWFDRYRFAQQSYAGVCGKFAAAFHKLDSGAVTGFEGAGGFGDDVDAILDNVGMWGSYNNVIDDIVRTMDRPKILRGTWMGYTKDADTLNAFAWRSICLGADSLWWWRWDGIGQYRGIISPTLDLWPATQSLADEMKPVFGGLGQLLMNAKLQNDGVAILYSVDSAVADKLPSEQPFGRGATAHSAFIHMFKDSGIQYSYVTPRDCAAGALAKYKVLVLPHCVSLSPDTANTIKAFVEQGGTLIADLRPGVLDNHVKQLSAGMLDDVFGVKRKGLGRAVTFRGPITASACGRNLSISSLRTVVDADYAINGATAGAEASGMPILIENRFGKGQTLLLNFNLDYWESTREQQSAAEIREPIIAMCRQAGVQAPISITSGSGKPLSMTELTRWDVDGGQIVSLRTDRYGWGWADVGPGPAEEKRIVKVKLPEPMFVYDLRNGKNLGKVSQFNATLKTGYANFYGVFDQPLGKPTLTCKVENAQSGKHLTAEVKASGPQTAVQLQLVDSGNNKPQWASKVIVLKDGVGSASWQLPLNQPTGWRVEARELFSGQNVASKVHE